MTDSAADEQDVRRLVRAVFPIRARQAHAVPERPYRPNGPWAHDPFRHQRVLLEEPEDEAIGATAQSGHRELPYRCRLCNEGLTDDAIDFHNCQGEQ